MGRQLRAVALGVLAAACVSGPAPQKPAAPEKRTVILDTPDADVQVGEENSKEVAAQMGLVHAPELEKYLQSFGEKLVRFAPYEQPFKYQFRIVDQMSPNAFALPGGFVF